MVYQRKKRAHNQHEQLPVNTSQNNRFASPDLETDEADSSPYEAQSTTGPSLEDYQRIVSQPPAYDFGSIPLFAPDQSGQREPLSPLMQAKMARPLNRHLLHLDGAPPPFTLEPKATQSAIQRDEAVGMPKGNIGGPAAVDLTPKGSGSPLPKQVEDNFVQSGYPEVKSARVHVDDAATQSIQAKAYTQKNNIVVQSSGANDPKLLGHEATHVVQQSQMALKPDVNGTPINANPALEQNADDNGERVARNESVWVAGTAVEAEETGSLANRSVQQQSKEQLRSALRQEPRNHIIQRQILKSYSDINDPAFTSATEAYKFLRAKGYSDKLSHNLVKTYYLLGMEYPSMRDEYNTHNLDITVEDLLKKASHVEPNAKPSSANGIKTEEKTTNDNEEIKKKFKDNELVLNHSNQNNNQSTVKINSKEKNQNKSNRLQNKFPFMGNLKFGKKSPELLKMLEDNKDEAKAKLEENKAAEVSSLPPVLYKAWQKRTLQLYQQAPKEGTFEYVLAYLWKSLNQKDQWDFFEQIYEEEKSDNDDGVKPKEYNQDDAKKSLLKNIAEKALVPFGDLLNLKELEEKKGYTADKSIMTQEIGQEKKKMGISFHGTDGGPDKVLKSQTDGGWDGLTQPQTVPFFQKRYGLDKPWNPLSDYLKTKGPSARLGHNKDNELLSTISLATKPAAAIKFPVYVKGNSTREGWLYAMAFDEAYPTLKFQNKDAFPEVGVKGVKIHNIIGCVRIVKYFDPNDIQKLSKQYELPSPDGALLSEMADAENFVYEAGVFRPNSAFVEAWAGRGGKELLAKTIKELEDKIIGLGHYYNKDIYRKKLELKK